MRNFFLKVPLFQLLSFIFATQLIAAPEYFKPILPLNLQWLNPQITSEIKNSKEYSGASSNASKARTEFEDANNKLGRKLSDAETAREIGRLRAASAKLGIQTKILAELISARVSAGISTTGSSISKPNQNWRNHLITACNFASKVDDKTHEKIALQSIALWRKVEGVNSPWTLPPIDLKAQKQFAFFKAIIERQAIFEWSKGQDAPALKKYTTLANNLAGSPEGASLDMRVLEMERSIYRRHKNISRWQKSLIDVSNKYQDKQYLGAGHENQVEKIQSTVRFIHKDLVQTLIKEASTQSAAAPFRKSVITALEAYSDSTNDAQEKERMRASIGEIQYIGGDHKGSANTFAGLATESQGTKASGYWRKAIRSQTVIAQWPIEVPWMGIPKGEMEPREVLIDMYRKIDGNTTNDWNIASHIGLLMIANLRAEEAFTQWWTRLQKFPSGPHAARVAGWLAASYIESKQWDILESVARLMTKVNMTGLYMTKSFKPKDVLGLALIESGLAALNGNDFKKAVTKLEEFVKGWRGDTRHDHAMYHYSLALQGDQQFRAAVLNLEAYLKIYPNGKFRHDALIKGGAWTLALSWDEHVMYFLESHVKFYPKDPQALESLQTLTNLYLGREIYDAALKAMNNIITRSDVDDSTRVDIARRMLDVSEKNGAPENSIRLADKIIALFKSNPEISAVALGLKARIFATKGNMNGLLAIDKVTSGMDQSQATIAEVISEVKFLIAEVLSKDKFKEEAYSLAAKNPAAQLESSYAVYANIIQNYRSACVAGKPSWCGPAHFRVARISEDFSKSYADFSIAKTLDPEDVKKFYARKKSILETVDATGLEADEKALEQAKTGATNPDWTATIMWQNGGEWSHEKFTHETSNHFIQWHTK